MSRIHDLTQQQLELLDLLYFEDNEQEIERLNKKLGEIKDSAENTIRFLSDILLETRAIKEARKEAKQKADKRLKTAENAEQRIKDRILQIMETFDVKKVDCELCDIRQQLSNPSVVYEDGFDYSKLPASCVTVVPESIKPIAAEVKKLLESGIELSGVELIRKNGIRIS